MGIIITKFKKKKTTYEVLEKLENEIQSIEEFRRSTERTQKKMVGRFIFISICVYCLTALIFYFYFFPASAYERIIYIIPLIILPVLLIFIKKILTWYYNRKIRNNQKKLTTLREEKKKILEEVMDKETYKVAKTILEKFGNDNMKKNAGFIELTPAKTVAPLGLTQTGLRYRGSATPIPRPPLATPQTRPLMEMRTPALSKPQVQSVVPSMGRPGTPMLLPRAILPKERSVLDKMVDYLVGDGPANRFALICKNCSGHNGMALTEEFDYLAFRCCYCMTFNPARKKRPSAPKLETSLSIKPRKSDVSVSESDSMESESDIEQFSDSSNASKNVEREKVSNLSISKNNTTNSHNESSNAMETESFEHVDEQTETKESANKNEEGTEEDTQKD